MNGFLFSFVPQSFLLELPLDNHHVKHLQAHIKTLASLGTSQHDPPRLLSTKGLEVQAGDHLALVESHGKVLFVGHDEERSILIVLLIVHGPMQLYRIRIH